MKGEIRFLHRLVEGHQRIAENIGSTPIEEAKQDGRREINIQVW